MMTGRKDAPELCYIAYQGEGGDDHFRADVPFEVTCPCRNEFEAVLQRVHGVTRFRCENVPAEIASVEVSLDNVGGACRSAAIPTFLAKSSGDSRQNSGDGDTHRLSPGFMYYHPHFQPDFYLADLQIFLQRHRN